jgi:catalase
MLVADNQNSQTAGSGGPVALQDHHLIDKLRISIAIGFPSA